MNQRTGRVNNKKNKSLVRTNCASSQPRQVTARKPDWDPPLGASRGKVGRKEEQAQNPGDCAGVSGEGPAATGDPLAHTGNPEG